MKMKAIRDALIIAWMRYFPEIKRNPLMLFIMVMIAGIPLVFIRVFGGEAMFGHGLIGAIVSTVAFIGLVSAIQDVAYDRHTKIREMIVAMPIHPISYIAGVALASLIFSIPGTVLFVAIAIWQGTLSLTAIVWIVPALVLCWFSLTAVGLTISIYLQKASFYFLTSISMLLSTMFVFIFPVFYPKEMLGSFAWIAFLTPISTTASLFRAYLGLSPSSYGDIAFHWLALIVTTVVFILLASLKYKWRET